MHVPLNYIVKTAEDLQAAVSCFPQPQMIKLPPGKLVIENLLISHSVCFTCTPGGILVVTQGIKLISNGGIINVTFRECTFTLQVNKGEDAESLSLFEVDNNCTLELRDCALNAREEFCTEEEENRIVTIGIRVLAQENKATPGNIKLNCCVFSNFFTNIACLTNTTATIENSTFLSCLNSSILALNPGEITTKDSCFDKCGESAFEIRWVSDEEDLKTVILRLLICARFPDK